MSFNDNAEKDLRLIMAGEFSEKVIFYLDSDQKVFDGIFDKTFLMIDNDGASIQSKAPQFSVFIAEIDQYFGFEISENDNINLLIRGVMYKIGYIERDGSGFGRILLKK